VDVRSLGYRTDLALLQLGGSEIEDHGDHLVVRSPHNPTHYWGNFLLAKRPPAPDEAEDWLNRFAEAFPDAWHVALGFDVTSGTQQDLAAFHAAGCETDASTVMTATAVHEPPRPNTDVGCRELSAEDDWSQLVDLELVSNDQEGDGESHLRFVRARVRTGRQLSEAGHGAWFGAFLGRRLVSSMGLMTASPGLARFQLVQTAPDVRGRGIAGTLVHHVSRYGFDELGASTLVMVADPDYLAIRIYRSVGFEATETQLQVQRTPAGATGSTVSTASTA
jgi:ribosomal protein S18 acetylase RimI-like enzyme